ncbi:unnamed protein product, partial [Rotaria magnacalcarata]
MILEYKLLSIDSYNLLIVHFNFCLLQNVALAGRYCDQPAQFRHRNMYLISKDHLPL